MNLIFRNISHHNLTEKWSRVSFSIFCSFNHACRSFQSYVKFRYGVNYVWKCIQACVEIRASPPLLWYIRGREWAIWVGVCVCVCKGKCWWILNKSGGPSSVFHLLSHNKLIIEHLASTKTLEIITLLLISRIWHFFLRRLWTICSCRCVFKLLNLTLHNINKMYGGY
jgi:hypothetical protein